MGLARQATFRRAYLDSTDFPRHFRTLSPACILIIALSYLIGRLGYNIVSVAVSEWYQISKQRRFAVRRRRVLRPRRTLFVVVVETITIIVSVAWV